MKAVFTIEQIDGKLVITIEQAEPIVKEQDGIDWSKPLPFPEKYIVAKGVKIKAIKVIKDDECKIKLYATGTLIGDGLDVPIFKVDDINDLNEEDRSSHGLFEYIHYLAPINPTDHPLHPDFKGNK